MIINPVFSFKPSHNDLVVINNGGANIDIEVSYESIESLISQLDRARRCNIVKSVAPEIVKQSHDKLTEQNKMLREALLSALNAIPIAGESDREDEARFVIMEALEATK